LDSKQWGQIDLEENQDYRIIVQEWDKVAWIGKCGGANMVKSDSPQYSANLGTPKYSKLVFTILVLIPPILAMACPFITLPFAVPSWVSALLVAILLLITWLLAKDKKTSALVFYVIAFVSMALMGLSRNHEMSGALVNILFVIPFLVNLKISMKRVKTLYEKKADE
jgi:hypothetical protein